MWSTTQIKRFYQKLFIKGIVDDRVVDLMKMKEENDMKYSGMEWGPLFIDMNWIYKTWLGNTLNVRNV